MNNSIEFDELLKQSQLHFSDLEKKLPDMDKLFKDQAVSLAPEVMNTLSDFVSRNRMGLFSGELNFSVILDTNTLFSCIYNKLIRNKESILASISKNSMVTIYYSNYVRDEMLNNIETGRIKSKKVSIEKSEAIQYMDELLSDFKLVDDENIVVNEDVSNKLVDRDPKDVPIINLAFSKKNQGILTGDKDFDNIDEIKKWNFKEFGETVCTLNKGVLSLAFTELTVELSTVIGSFLLSVIRSIYNTVVTGIKLLIDGLRMIPVELYAILGGVGLGLLIAYFWNDGKAKLQKLKTDVGEFVNDIIGKVSDLFDRIADILNRLAQNEWAKGIGDLMIYLIASNAKLQNEVKRLKQLEIGFDS